MAGNDITLNPTLERKLNCTFRFARPRASEEWWRKAPCSSSRHAVALSLLGYPGLPAHEIHWVGEGRLP